MSDNEKPPQLWWEADQYVWDREPDLTPEQHRELQQREGRKQAKKERFQP
jgi:hypothetical protein